MTTKMIWQISDVKDGNKYKVQLCQSKDGKRYFSLVNALDNTQSNPDAFFSTEIVSNELLRRRDFISIAEITLLDDGSKYYVDSHGIWFLEEEVVGLNKGLGFDQIPWVTGSAPKLPN